MRTLFLFLKNSPIKNPNNDYTENYLKLLDNHNKAIKAYQLFILYKTFNESDDYYIKRNVFNRWKKNNKIFTESNNNKHIKLYDGHCISCNCEEENNLGGQRICLICNCTEIKRCLKDILIKHKYLKELNPIKYYLLMWYKNIFMSN